jgi:predicted metal-dependent phosphoesterase TrpH
LACIEIAHRQVGVVNPRHPGWINDLIQILKKSLRRALTWYTRPIVEFQAGTIRFLNETAEILGRDQSRLASLEKEIEILTTELAGLRQQIQSRSGLVVRDPDRSEMEEK